MHYFGTKVDFYKSLFNLSALDRVCVLLSLAVYVETVLLTNCGRVQFILERPASIPQANCGRVQFISECPASVPQEGHRVKYSFRQIFYLLFDVALLFSRSSLWLFSLALHFAGT